MLHSLDYQEQELLATSLNNGDASEMSFSFLDESDEELDSDANSGFSEDGESHHISGGDNLLQLLNTANEILAEDNYGS